MNRALILAFLVCGLAGCATSTPKGPPPMVARFFVEAANTGGTTLVLPTSGVQIAVNAQPVLSEADIVAVELARVDLGPCLMFQVAPGATRDLYRLTASHQGRRLVLMINGGPVGARRIDGPIADGVLFIFVEVPDAALPRLVEELKRGVAAVQREQVRKR